MKNSPSTSFISSESGQFSLLTLFNDDGIEGHINGVTECFHLPLRQEEAAYRQVFHCDGILCLVKYSRIIMVWNPAIQEFKLLPESNISSAQGGADIGFRYDSSAKDYKVVRICYPRYGNLDDDARAEVYMLRTDSWREISVNPDISYLSESWPPLCWRGVCYWLMLSSDLTSDESKILCFDICKEELHTLPNPSENNSWTACSGFSVWNDFPAFYVLCSFGTYSQSRIEIYVLDNYFDVEGVKGACSWTKSVCTMIPGFDFVYASWKNDELLVVDSNVQPASCNLHTKKLRGIAIHGLGQAGLLHCSYVKSLVSVRGR